MKISSLDTPSISLPIIGFMPNRCIIRRPQRRRAIHVTARPAVAPDWRSSW